MGLPCLTHDCFWFPIYSNCLVQCAKATHNTGWRKYIDKYLDLLSFPLVGFFCLSLLRPCRISPRTDITRHSKATAPALKQRQLGAGASEDRSPSRESPAVCHLAPFSSSHMQLRDCVFSLSSHLVDVRMGLWKAAHARQAYAFIVLD